MLIRIPPFLEVKRLFTNFEVKYEHTYPDPTTDPCGSGTVALHGTGLFAEYFFVPSSPI
jgi:hypothetical protein